jgi:hypothetical protein
MSFERPRPPYPDLVRQPSGSFGWLEDRLLHEGWLADLGPEGTAVLLLLALAADRHGASFFGRERMVRRLGLTRTEVDRGLKRLEASGLVAHRPWRAGSPDGVWQLLPLPQRAPPEPPRTGQPASVADILARLGLAARDAGPGSTPE